MSAGGAQIIAFDGGAEWWNHCYRVSLGCARCLACAMWARYGYPPDVVVHGLVAEWEKVRDPHRVRPGGLYLLCPTSDFFIAEAEVWWAAAVELMRLRPDVDFVALTKRPKLARKFVAHFGVLPNLWLGISAEDQKTLDARVAKLYAIPAAGYVLSLQPLLGPINMTKHLNNPALYYVITGREAGDHARPCPKAWLDEIDRQCRQASIECFITRWRDERGRARTNGTRNKRGGHEPSHWSYTTRRPKITVGEQIRRRRRRRQAALT